MTTSAAVIDVDERRTYIGASDAAAALGLSPWDDPIGLAMEKWGERPPKAESFRMTFGLLVEPVIGQFYRRERPESLIRAGGSKTRRMKGHPWIGAHPDFYVYGNQEWSITGRSGLVQAKLSDGFENGVPLHYRLQGIAELAVTGAPWIDFAVLEARSFKIYRVEPEPGEIEDLVADLDDYWHTYIVPHVTPPPSAESTASLRQRYPSAKLAVGKLASDAQAEKLAEFRALKEREKALKAEIDLIGNEIRAAIGDAKFIEGGGLRATWSRWESQRVAWENVAKTFRTIVDDVFAGRLDPAITPYDPDAIESLYTTTEPGHKLTVAELKEK